MNSLELYAKIEELLDFDMARAELYSSFLSLFKEFSIQNCATLDFGCGSGEFARLLEDRGFSVIGIDKSQTMVERAVNFGVDARVCSLSDLGKFALITATFDVLNYLKKDELKLFLKEIPEHLKEGGYFAFDINSKYGFTQIAQGLLHESDDDGDLIIDATYEDEILKTKMMYFAKEGKLYKKIEEDILLYYHEVEFIKRNLALKFIEKRDIFLYSDDNHADKNILLFKKEKN